MNDVYSDRLAALERTWQVWAETGAGLTGEQWSAPSRCPGWDVAAVFAHHSIFPFVMAGDLPAPADPSTSIMTAADVLRHYNEPGGIAHTMAGTVAERSVTEAAALSKDELLDRFRVAGAKAVAGLRDVHPDRVIGWPPHLLPVRLTEGIRLVLMEATVHLLDALRALDRPPTVVPAAALTETARLLAEVAPAVEFIEAATGRTGEAPLPVLR